MAYQELEGKTIRGLETRLYGVKAWEWTEVRTKWKDLYISSSCPLENVQCRRSTKWPSEQNDTQFWCWMFLIRQQWDKCWTPNVTSLPQEINLILVGKLIIFGNLWFIFWLLGSEGLEVQGFQKATLLARGHSKVPLDFKLHILGSFLNQHAGRVVNILPVVNDSILWGRGELTAAQCVELK